jgi:hypothetical protein
MTHNVRTGRIMIASVLVIALLVGVPSAMGKNPKHTPDAPYGVTAQASLEHVSLEWNWEGDPQGGPVRFHVYRAPPGGNYVMVGTTTELRFEDYSVKATSPMANYFVTASNAQGESEPSEVVMAGSCITLIRGPPPNIIIEIENCMPP